MNENLSILFNKINDNPEYAEKLKECGSPEEAYKLSLELQQGYSYDEFVDIMTKIYEMSKSEISSDDLSEVAGGMSPGAENGIIWTSTLLGSALTGSAISATTYAASGAAASI